MDGVPVPSGFVAAQIATRSEPFAGVKASVTIFRSVATVSNFEAFTVYAIEEAAAACAGLPFRSVNRDETNLDLVNRLCICLHCGAPLAHQIALVNLALLMVAITVCC